MTHIIYEHVSLIYTVAPLSASTDFSVVEEICSKFCFLGQFMAKAIMDFRMVREREGGRESGGEKER